MTNPEIKSLADGIVSQFFGESERTEGDPAAVFKVARQEFPNLSHLIYSVMLEIHDDGKRQGRSEAVGMAAQLLDLPARVAALERRDAYRRETERGEDN